MAINCYFIYNNLKINPFILGDAPMPGFELLSWDVDSYTDGTLWELPFNDAGFTKIGIDKVHGQVWKLVDPKEEPFLRECFGVYKGLMSPVEIPVTIEIDKADIETLPAITFALNEIKPSYKLVRDGRWRF